MERYVTLFGWWCFDFENEMGLDIALAKGLDVEFAFACDDLVDVGLLFIEKWIFFFLELAFHFE